MYRMVPVLLSSTSDGNHYILDAARWFPLVGELWRSQLKVESGSAVDGAKVKLNGKEVKSTDDSAIPNVLVYINLRWVKFCKYSVKFHSPMSWLKFHHKPQCHRKHNCLILRWKLYQYETVMLTVAPNNCLFNWQIWLTSFAGWRNSWFDAKNMQNNLYTYNRLPPPISDYLRASWIGSYCDSGIYIKATRSGCWNSTSSTLSTMKKKFLRWRVRSSKTPKAVARNLIL